MFQRRIPVDCCETVRLNCLLVFGVLVLQLLFLGADSFIRFLYWLDLFSCTDRPDCTVVSLYHEIDYFYPLSFIDSL